MAAAGFDGEIWAWQKGGKAKKLASDVKGMRHFAIAPTGGAVSYIHGNNLHIAGTVVAEEDLANTLLDRIQIMMRHRP